MIYNANHKSTDVANKFQISSLTELFDNFGAAGIGYSTLQTMTSALPTSSLCAHHAF